VADLDLDPGIGGAVRQFSRVGCSAGDGFLAKGRHTRLDA
jgi:hypothetical protein